MIEQAPTYPTLFEFERRPVPGLPQDLVGEERGRCGYTDTNPREWTDGEIDFIQQLKGSGYTLEEIAEAVNRSETSVSIKLKRIGKKDETYNDKHRTEKYEANAGFAKTIRPKTILDASPPESAASVVLCVVGEPYIFPGAFLCPHLDQRMNFLSSENKFPQ